MMIGQICCKVAMIGQIMRESTGTSLRLEQHAYAANSIMLIRSFARKPLMCCIMHKIRLHPIEPKPSPQKCGNSLN